MRGRTFAVVLLSLSACVTEPPAMCPEGSFPEPDASVDGSVDGSVSPDAGVAYSLLVGWEAGDAVGLPWHDGDHVALVHGPQGGYMIRPSIDVSAPAGVASRACYHVRITPLSPVGAMPFDDFGNARRGSTGAYHLAPLSDLLSYSSTELDGVPLTERIEVLGADGYGSTVITIVPDSLAPR